MLSHRVIVMLHQFTIKSRILSFGNAVTSNESRFHLASRSRDKWNDAFEQQRRCASLPLLQWSFCSAASAFATRPSISFWSIHHSYAYYFNYNSSTSSHFLWFWKSPRFFQSVPKSGASFSHLDDLSELFSTFRIPHLPHFTCTPLN